jgi:hypothetical protein
VANVQNESCEKAVGNVPSTTAQSLSTQRECILLMRVFRAMPYPVPVSEYNGGEASSASSASSALSASSASSAPVANPIDWVLLTLQYNKEVATQLQEEPSLHEDLHYSTRVH